MTVADTSDLVKRILAFRDNNGWPTSPISLVLNDAAVALDALTLAKDAWKESWGMQAKATLDALESAPTMRIEVDGWRPIETADKGDTHILLRAAAIDGVGYYHGDGHWAYETYWAHDEDQQYFWPQPPTLWQPLPPPPAQPQEKNNG